MQGEILRGLKLAAWDFLGYKFSGGLFLIEMILARTFWGFDKNDILTILDFI